MQDDLAGWHTTTEYGEPGPVEYEYAKIDLIPNQPVDLKVTRNFYKMAAAFPPLHTGTHRFRWQGESYTLNSLQATAVAILLKAYAEQTGDVHEAVLLQGATFQGRQIILPQIAPGRAVNLLLAWHAEGKSLQSVFDDGEHPAWGTVVVPGEKPDTFRLSPLVAESKADDPFQLGQDARACSGDRSSGHCDQGNDVCPRSPDPDDSDDA